MKSAFGSPVARVLITGDYHPNNEISEFLAEHDSNQLFGDLIPILNSSDLSITNLEIPATNNNSKIIKAGPHGKTDFACIKALKSSGFDLVTFATNHTMDYGIEGFQDTQKYCRVNGLSIVGAGQTRSDARIPYTTEINKIKIAILNYSETEFNIAGENTPGANPLDLINVYNDIKDYKSKADHIIVIVHGGQDFVFHPSPRMIKVYRFIAELGVSAVIGHHTHYISSYEIHQGVPIVYSVGHLLYLYNKDDNFTRMFYVAQLVLTVDSCSIELTPFEFDLDKFKIIKLSGNKLKTFNEKAFELNQHNKDVNVSSAEWYKEIDKIQIIRNLSILSSIPILVFRLFKKLNMLKLLKKILLLRKKRYLPIWDYSKCEHHLSGVNFLFNQLFYGNKSK